MDTATDPLERLPDVAPGARVVALTFDDGPNPGETDAVLDLLDALAIRAVFFVVGEHVRTVEGAALLRRMVMAGHVVGNHSMSFADMGDWTAERIERDLSEALAAIRTAAQDPALPVPWFRAPNGSWGDTAEVAARLGMRSLGLGAVIHDWDGNDLAPSTLVRNLRAAVSPGAVVLVHDGGGDRWGTVAALQKVLPELLAAGWSFRVP